jgi:hypothetical protein
LKVEEKLGNTEVPGMIDTVLKGGAIASHAGIQLIFFIPSSPPFAPSR